MALLDDPILKNKHWTYHHFARPFSGRHHYKAVRFPQVELPIVSETTLHVLSDPMEGSFYEPNKKRKYKCREYFKRK